MMQSQDLFGSLGEFSAQGTENCGNPPSHYAKRATERIINVGQGVHPLIQEQALAFKGTIEKTLEHYITLANNSHRDTIAGELARQGHEDMAEIIRRM